MGPMPGGIVDAWTSALSDAVRSRWNLDVSGREFQPLLQPTQQLKFGDYASGICFKLAKPLRTPPPKLFEALRPHLTEENFPHLETAELAGGFVNFRLKRSYLESLIDRIHREGDGFGRGPAGKDRILLEYVSANPTGPLTIAHARQAAVGDSLARILRFAGHEVTREFYMNDTGGQIAVLGRSILARAEQLAGRDAPFPEEGYQGEYVKDLAGRVLAAEGPGLLDAPDASARCARFGRDLLMQAIREDLRRFRVEFDVYTSQEDLERRGVAQQVVSALRGMGLAFDKDGAVWLETTRFGDDKDRVLVKSDGSFTYRTPDIGYHREKFARGFDRLVNLWGPDHMQHAQDLAVALRALGIDADRRFRVLFIQHCRLMRGAQEVKMSKRLAAFVTLAELLDEVGEDAARWFFAMRKAESHLDFDIEVAKTKSLDNPVYYAQYAHARICSVYDKAAERGKELPLRDGVYHGPGDLSRLQEPDLEPARLLERFPLAVADAAGELDTTRLTSYLYDLSGAFQSYYTAGNKEPALRILTEDHETTGARLRLAAAVQIVLRNGFNLLGVGAPKRM